MITSTLASRRIQLGVLACALNLGCSDVELYAPVDPDPALPRARIAALVCGPQVEQLEVPWKVLFVIDTSASTLINETDPPMLNGVIDQQRGITRREQAVRGAISAQLTKPNVSFGIITFNDFPQVQTFGFTRDLGALDAAIRNIGTATGWTNYSDTLIRVDEMIRSDVARVTQAEALRTHYLVFFISDGYPTRGITYDDPAVLSAALGRGVSYVLANSAAQVAELRFNTAFLGGGKPFYDPADTAAVQQQKLADWTKDANSARQLLQGMATVGTGIFTDIPAGQAFTFPINPAPAQRRFVISPAVMASNRNVSFSDKRPQVDSDGDGLPDAIDPNPRKEDTDGDGLRDGVEAAVPSNGDPRDPARPGGCTTGSLDTDGDGLWDCEERLVGSSPYKVDTDGDFYLDSMEVMARASAVNASAADPDSDGLTDQAEIRAHLNAREANAPDAAKRWSYVYQVEPRAAGPNGSNCYQVSVANLVLLETEPAQGHPVGANAIELVVPFIPEEGGDPVSFFRASFTGIFRGPSTLEPTSGTFVAGPGAFTRVGKQ